MAHLKTALLFAEIPNALRVGMACVVIFIALKWRSTYQSRDRLTLWAIAGLTWILVVGFVQTVLLDAQINVSSIPANLFWNGAWFISILAVIAFVLEALRRREPQVGQAGALRGQDPD